MFDLLTSNDGFPHATFDCAQFTSSSCVVHQGGRDRRMEVEHVAFEVREPVFEAIKKE